MTEADRLSDAVLGSLDHEAGAGDWAKQTYRSRAQFYRLFQALIEETPGAMRRRLLLERAAWQLAVSKQPVTEIAFDAQYGSLEAFTRAFGKAYGVSPSIYRRLGGRRIHLPAPNRYHFCPPSATKKGITENMDLFDLFEGTDAWYTRRLLEQAANLTDAQLDHPMEGNSKVFPWDRPDANLREILERIVQTKEVWAAALTGGEMPQLDGLAPADRTPAAMPARFEKAETAFQAVLNDVRDRGAWDETFVDALCEPAETFTYGGTFAHIITFNAYRRLSALEAFHRLGVPVASSGCPSEYEAAQRNPA
jgi:AraC-like DNA-binding protein